MNEPKRERGQGMLELAVILPVLLLLLLGVIEMGYALRNYLLVVNASREGGRLAARERDSLNNPDRIIQQVVDAGGFVPGTGRDFLCTHDKCLDPANPDLRPNTGVIVTFFPMGSDGEINDPITQVYSGVHGTDYQDIESSVSGIQVTQEEIEQRHADDTATISALRVAAGATELDNTIVVVQVYFLHSPMLNLGLIPDPVLMYAPTEMRIPPVGKAITPTATAGP